MTEVAILKILFPPEGAIPLARINAIPQIRSHIAAILSLADGQSVRSAGDSRAITQRIVELHDKGIGWAEMAPEFALSANACQKRYTKFMKDQEKAAHISIHPVFAITDGQLVIRESPAEQIETLPKEEIPTIRKPRTVEPSTPAEAEHEEPASEPETIRDQIGHIEPFVGGILASESIHTDHFPKTEIEPLQEAEPINPEKPPEQEKKPDEVATIRESRPVEKPKPLDPETLAEVDRMLGEGTGVLDISTALEKKGTLVPWTKIRARAAYLARTKNKEAKPEPKKADESEPAAAQQPDETEARPEPVSISRSELNIMIWDLWKAGKTLEEISDILYDKGLYYSAKSVRIRLLQQGAKL